MTTVPELHIRWEWEAAPYVRAAEHRVTWARIEIGVGEEHVTLVEDRASGSSRRSIYCPLYPLAEWVAYNWWFLRADARPARNLVINRPDLYEPRQFHRHSLRGSGDGFLWPNLLIIPQGDGKHLIWHRDRRPTTDGRPIRFLAEGEAFVDSESVECELVRVISAVLTRLAEQGITGTALEKEWTAIQNTSPEEAEYCIAAARLGLDPYAEAEPYEQLILRAGNELRGNLLGDFLDAVEPSLMARALEWIRSAREIVRQMPHALPDAVALRRALPSAQVSDGVRAWETGWSQARAVRRLLGLVDTEVFSLDPYIVSVEQRADDHDLRAFGGTTEGIGPLAVVQPGLPSGARRFTLSRALWHYLWESEPDFLVTTAYTHRQKIERAFATELLAPAAGIGELLGRRPRSANQDDVEQIAARFQVSPMVVRHQLENQLLAS
jgi:Zn-dependent peptidase ImmA (M78 family)